MKSEILRRLSLAWKRKARQAGCKLQAISQAVTSRVLLQCGCVGAIKIQIYINNLYISIQYITILCSIIAVPFFCSRTNKRIVSQFKTHQKMISTYFNKRRHQKMKEEWTNVYMASGATVVPRGQEFTLSGSLRDKHFLCPWLDSLHPGCKPALHCTAHV